MNEYRVTTIDLDALEHDLNAQAAHGWWPLTLHRRQYEWTVVYERERDVTRSGSRTGPIEDRAWTCDFDGNGTI